MSIPIVNLSSHVLTKDEFTVLSRGLKFVPSQNPEDPLKVATQSFIKSMSTQYMFKNSTRPNKHFYTKNHGETWSPETSNHPEVLSFCEALMEYSNNQQSFETPSNLTKGEERGLISLINNHDLVIKPSDKGNGIVVMDKKYYINKTLEHLSDLLLYQPMPFDYTPQIVEKVHLYLAHLKATSGLHPSILAQLYPPYPIRTPVIYTLPKNKQT